MHLWVFYALGAHSDSPMYLSLCSFMSFAFSALPSGISFLPHEINIRNLLIFLDGHSASAILNCVYLILFSKKFFTGYKFWVSKYFSCSHLKISCHSLWFSCCPASNSVDVIVLFLWHLLRFSLPLMFCSFTVCLVQISFYLIHLEIYKLLNLWIGIFHHSGKSSVIVSIFGISAPILSLLLVEHLLIINRC